MAYGFNNDKSRAEGLINGLNAQIRRVKFTLSSVSPNSWKSDNVRFDRIYELQKFKQHDPTKICILSVTQRYSSQNYLYNNRIYPFVQIIPNGSSSNHTITVYGYNDRNDVWDIPVFVTLLFID